MRMSTSLIHSNGVNAVLDQQYDLHRTQLQLASGKRLLAPSDDPTASALTVELTQSMSRFEQFKKNADTADDRLAFEESILESVGNALQRARELTVQGNNASLDEKNRAALAEEVDEILQSVLGNANIRDANGDYLFAGTKGGTIPFEDAGGGNFNYHGDQNQRMLQISPTRQIADGDSGFDVFMDIEDAGGGKQSVFSMIASLRDDLNDGTLPALDDHITNMDQALEKVWEVRGRIGARQNALDNERANHESALLHMEETKSDLNDLDYAEAVGRLNVQLAGFQAAQQTYSKVQGLTLFNFL